MEYPKSYYIDSVTPGSPADKCAIKAGWSLLRIDNQQIRDIIEYKIVESDKILRLLLEDQKGLIHRVKINKPFDEPLGLNFEPPTISKMHLCKNNCIFCFIEQNPSGLRPSLYLKDDDYRLSFLYGNFITLNTLSETDLQRIIKLQLSPLYVSVHSTNPAIRKKMFRTKHAERGLNNLKYLVKAGIRIHGQIVLCPGYNTGSDMVSTIKDLDRLGPNVTDLAIVPVGLTGHRSELTPLRKFEADEAKKVIEEINVLQLSFIKKRKRRFVYAADEFYVMAGYEFPANEYYDDYPQLENGVGLSRLFLNELETVNIQSRPLLNNRITVTVVSGKAAENLINKLVEEFNKFNNLDIQQVVATNRFFGDAVNVSGLLTGQDLIAALEGIKVGDALFISDTLLNENRELFLDGMTISELKEHLKADIYFANGPVEMLNNIRKIADESK